MEDLECQNWGEMSVTDTIFGKCELNVADDAYIRNGSGSKYWSQTFKVYRLISICIEKNLV